MYAYIKGVIKEINDNSIVIDNNGIGYFINISNPNNYQINKTQTIYTYQHVREDINILYGFNNMKSKNLFLNLISVKGIGPKTALNILGTNESDEVIKAIENGDVKLLTKFPGIGMKTAQQIILDLKGKLISKDSIKKSNSIIEAKKALNVLGYKSNEIDKALLNIDSNLEVEKIIKLALKNLIG